LSSNVNECKPLVQATWRGGEARAEVLERWLAVYQAQRFWRGAVARRRCARLREERERDREEREVEAGAYTRPLFCSA